MRRELGPFEGRSAPSPSARCLGVIRKSFKKRVDAIGVDERHGRSYVDRLSLAESTRESTRGQGRVEFGHHSAREAPASTAYHDLFGSFVAGGPAPRPQMHSFKRAVFGIGIEPGCRRQQAPAMTRMIRAHARFLASIGLLRMSYARRRKPGTEPSLRRQGLGHHPQRVSALGEVAYRQGDFFRPAADRRSPCVADANANESRWANCCGSGG